MNDCPKCPLHVKTQFKDPRDAVRCIQTHCYTLLKVGRLSCIFQFWYAIHLQYSSSFFTKWLFGMQLDEQILMNQRRAELHNGHLIPCWHLCSLCVISLGTFTPLFYCIRITFRSYLQKTSMYCSSEVI